MHSFCPDGKGLSFGHAMSHGAILRLKKKNQFLLKWRTQLKSRLGTHGSGHLLYLQENWGCCWERITPGRKLSRTSWVCKEALATGCKTILTLSDLQCAML